MRKVIITFEVDEEKLTEAIGDSGYTLEETIDSEPLSYLEAEEALKRVGVRIEGGD